MNYFQQFQQAEADITKERDEFVLFGLFERSDFLGKYDVVVSAKWLKDDRASLGLIIDLVTAAIGNQKWWSRVGRFDIVPTNGPFLEVVREALPDGSVQHGLKRITNLYYEGNMIPSAIIITAANPSSENSMPESTRAEAVAA